MPLRKAFNEFNYLFQINPDLLTKDIFGFKNYEQYKDDWIYEWNKDVSWNGHSEWPTYSWKDDGYYNGGNLPGTFRVAIIEGLIDEDEESYDEAWRRWDNYENTNHNDAKGNNDDANDIGNLDYDLVRDNASYHTK
ncbi:hypothetical protein Tco_1522874 [Tanacetum coccineum]